MPELGPDLCYSCQDFLSLVGNEDLRLSDFAKQRERILNIEAELAISVCQECNWIHFDPQGRIVLTDVGRDIAEHIAKKRSATALRVQIFSMVKTYSWSWTDALRHGRQEALRRMPEDARQCFEESRTLRSRWNQELIAWWSGLAQQQRGLRSDRMIEIGRRAEQLSFEYERKRIGRSPDWRALETTFDGYDILSQLTRMDDTPLRIEVKGTTQSISGALFFVTRNEWRTAKAAGNYVFHLWSLGPSNTLRIVPASSIEPHVPSDLGKGHWELFQLKLGIFFAGNSHIPSVVK